MPKNNTSAEPTLHIVNSWTIFGFEFRIFGSKERELYTVEVATAKESFFLRVRYNDFSSLDNAQQAILDFLANGGKKSS